MNKRDFAAVVVVLVVMLAIALIYFSMMRPASQTTIYVSPQNLSRAIDQNFTINISVSDVINLYGWQAKLGWNATILNITEIADIREESFLKTGGKTLFVPKLNTTAGYVLLACTLYNTTAGVSGNGTLATIQFNVRGNGRCSLDLYDSMLLDLSEQQITHTVTDGDFKTSIGSS